MPILIGLITGIIGYKLYGKVGVTGALLSGFISGFSFKVDIRSFAGWTLGLMCSMIAIFLYKSFFDSKT